MAQSARKVTFLFIFLFASRHSSLDTRPSLRTSFRALCITRREIKESVIYGSRRQGLVEWEGQKQPEIELNDSNSPVLWDLVVGEYSSILASPRRFFPIT